MGIMVAGQIRLRMSLSWQLIFKRRRWCSLFPHIGPAVLNGSSRSYHKRRRLTISIDRHVLAVINDRHFVTKCKTIENRRNINPPRSKREKCLRRWRAFLFYLHWFFYPGVRREPTSTRPTSCRRESFIRTASTPCAQRTSTWLAPLLTAQSKKVQPMRSKKSARTEIGCGGCCVSMVISYPRLMTGAS